MSLIMKEQLDSTTVDLRLATMNHTYPCGFLMRGVTLAKKTIIIHRGWWKTCLDRALNTNFQITTMETTIALSLLKFIQETIPLRKENTTTLHTKMKYIHVNN